MDWTQTLVIIGIFAAFFIYMLNRLEGLGNKMNSLENKITTLEVEMRTEMRNVNQRLSTIEGYLVPRKVFHFEETKEEPKEN
ncbi:MAG: hypothetical protein ACI8RA_001369 [Chlamydiales bacterium]|jgi:hypothetical protein